MYVWIYIYLAIEGRRPVGAASPARRAHALVRRRSARPLDRQPVGYGVALGDHVHVRTGEEGSESEAMDPCDAPLCRWHAA
jgi:hypothetical protein